MSAIYMLDDDDDDDEMTIMMTMTVIRYLHIDWLG